MDSRNRKKRILWCGESSYLNTGFSTYSLEVLKRLYSTGKYDITELGCYGSVKDERSKACPWSFIPNMPVGDEEESIYSSVPTNQFGEWKFEQACLKALPDIVCDIRDWWALEYQERSPFRNFYNWSIMPTVDATPQDKQWISTYMNADNVFTYSDWGLDILKEQSNSLIKYNCSAPPGADFENLFPKQNKKEARQSVGISDECFVIGTIMRNQKRKLYPDLIQAFKLFLTQAPKDLANRTVLYLHTSWPDAGWDIPRLINEEGISSKCLFTYLCKNCGSVFPAFFSDVKAICKNCGNSSATFANSHMGISRKTLGDIINLFDVYVQYANSEGFGMPQVEAAACGVPVMSVDYSAMSDVVRKLEGFPIKVQRLYRESETHCWRALPDNKDFVEKLIEYLGQPQSIRNIKSFKTRKACEKYYNYDATSKVWENYFDSVEIKPEHLTWKSPVRINNPTNPVPNGLSNSDFVKWGIINLAGSPELLNTYMCLRMIRDLGWEASLQSMGGIYFNEYSTLGMQQKFQPFNREICINELLRIGEKKNFWEKERAKIL